MQKGWASGAEVIRAAGFRATKPRLALMSYFRKSKYPASIQEIAESLKQTVDQVTVYRMVEVFTRKGVLREVNLQGERPRYELADTQNDHHHIVCTNCRKLEDFTGCDYEKVEVRALRQSHSFSKITAHSFDFYGLCNACA